MATSIADLLLRLDHATADRTKMRGDDAAGTLGVLGRLAGDLRQPAIPGVDRDDAVRRFADSCSLAVVTFPPTPGRLTDLAGATADAVARRLDRLEDEERWTVATQLALPARRCAAAIAGAGNFREVPQLLGVADRTGELLLVAADDPPAPSAGGLLNAPIPSLNLASTDSPVTIATEAVATVVWHVTNPRPLTIRQLLGACVLGQTASRFIGNESAASAYRDATREIGLFADQTRRSPATDDPFLRAVVQGVEAFGQAREPAPVDLIERLLSPLALGCADQLARIQKTLVVPRGARPLREGRVGEWLGARAFLPNRRDLEHATLALATAAVAVAVGDEARKAAPVSPGAPVGSVRGLHSPDPPCS